MERLLADMAATAARLDQRAAGYRMTGERRLAFECRTAALHLNNAARALGDALASEDAAKAAREAIDADD